MEVKEEGGELQDGSRIAAAVDDIKVTILPSNFFSFHNGPFLCLALSNSFLFSFFVKKTIARAKGTL